MARPRKYQLDPQAILAAILKAYSDTLAEIDAELVEANAAWKAPGRDYGTWHRVCILQAEREAVEADGIKYSVPTFLGHEPTASERIAAQKVIRALEAAGKLKLVGAKATNVKPTKAGLAALRPATVARGDG